MFDQGDHIVLLIDANSNMKLSDISSKFQELSLQEAILTKHGMSGPSTSGEILLILLLMVFGSPGLQVQACGYTGYDTIFPNMDHRCLWVDLLCKQAFGHKMPAIVRPPARRLQTKDPRSVKNFIFHYKNLMQDNDIPKKVQLLEDHLQYPLPRHLQQEYKTLDNF